MKYYNGDMKNNFKMKIFQLKGFLWYFIVIDMINIFRVHDPFFMASVFVSRHRRSGKRLPLNVVINLFCEKRHMQLCFYWQVDVRKKIFYRGEGT